MMEPTQIAGYRCFRCGHTWVPRGSNPPKVCPNRKCKSPYWHRPRKTEAESADVLVQPKVGALVEIPTELGKRHEPVIRGKGVPVWILVSYATKRHMTPEQISHLWNGYITVPEVRAALDYWQAHPEAVEDKLSE